MPAPLDKPGEGGLPILIHHTDKRAPVESLVSRREELRDALCGQGAILLRGLQVSSAEDFQKIVAVLAPKSLEYVYRSTPRTQLAPGVYTATEYPAHQAIPLHNENAYQRSWPMRLLLACLQPAATGGQTPIASTRAVTRRIDRGIRDSFARRNVMYVRNYHEGVDLPWQTVFQTANRAEVEAYCRANELACEWGSAGELRTRQVCQGLAVHPRTGETLWFNQAHLFHVSSLDPKTRRALLSLYPPERLPRNAYYGDGAPIEDDVLEHIRAAYRAETISFEWQAGDVLLLDNMLVAHGRSPYKGARKVLVAMADAFADESVAGGSGASQTVR